jgi:outer membrane receptor for ferric coprogen and ferric-rhodotorulic acid
MYPIKSSRDLVCMYRLPSACLALAVAIGTPSLSQAADATAGELEEVTVVSNYTTADELDTATGLGLSIAETPQSVTVMTFERIADQNLRSLSDVVDNAPGVSSKELDSSRHSFAARGFDIDNYQIDGVPMEWSSGGDAGETESDTALYERVEIVRGATGLLTGVGNPSASINLVRKHADSREFEGSTTLGFGRWNNYNAMADLSSPLALDGAVRGRVVLNYEDGDSFTTLLGNRKKVGYAVVEGDLSDTTLVRAGVSYQDNDPSGSTWGGLASWYADGSRTDFSRSDTVGARWTRWASTNRNYYATVRQQINDRWEARVDYNNAKNEADLHLLYLFGTPDRVTGVGLGAFPYRSDTRREQYNVGVRLSGKFDLFERTHEIIVGYSYQDQSYFADQASALNATDPGDFNAWDGSYPEPAFGPATPSVDLKTKQSGFYLATRLAVTDALKIVAGGRLGKWDQSGLNFGSSTDFGDSSVFVPYLGALYDLSDSHRVYASYTQIFKPQNATDRNGQQLDPIVGKSYEIGLKSAFLSGALHTTLALFRIEQDNLAQPDTGFLVPGTIFEASRAAEGATSKGFEVEVVGRPLPGWEATFSYTNFSAKDAQDIEVNTSHPRKTLKLFTTYQFTESLPALSVGGGVNWQDRNYTATTNPVLGTPERLEQGAYALVSLVGKYAFTDQLSAQFNVENLLDKQYYDQIGFFDQLAWGEPRNYNLSFRFKF